MPFFGGCAKNPKVGRHWHRDSTLILVTYRHGFATVPSSACAGIRGDSTPDARSVSAKLIGLPA